MITTLLALIVIGYAVQMIFLRIGLSRASGVSRVHGYTPTVSVIVAARNEEQCISDCISSLIQLDYPSEKLEIVVVNDSSTDKTAEIITGFLGKHPSLRTISTRQGVENLRGKTNAVTQGIKNSSGEIIIFTDADCTVPSGWIRETVQYFDEDTGIVGGFTVLEAQRMFEGIQALDWVFLFSLASGMAGWNLPLTAIGNNFSVRRKAYDETGGYDKIPFSVTEDYALAQAIYQRTNYHIRFPINLPAVVTSSACQTLKHLFNQKQRWGVGGLDMVFRGMFLMTVGWCVRIAAITIGIWLNMKFLLLAIACILMVDLVFLWKPLARFHRKRYLKYFLAFEIYFTCYVLVLPFVAYFSKKVIWKERAL